MEKFKVLRELPKCDTETQSEQMLEKGTNRLAWCRVATDFQFVKTAVSAKHNKAKCNKTRYAVLVLTKNLAIVFFCVCL